MELVVEKKVTVSVIVSVYKNTNALNIVLKSLENQTILPDEIIISEDGNSDVMKEFVNTLTMKNIDIQHLTCEDIGWRKNIALNKAIVQSKGEYLIFIDGDVVPHKRFIEGHLYWSKPMRVCAGKRAEIGEKISQDILSEKLSIDTLCSKYLLWINKLHKDKVRHYEDGIYIKPNGLFFKYVVSKKHISYIIGCNFSCYKKDFESINGFNEDYILPSVGEDVDINWRFRASGIEVVSVRNIANVYHLWHKKGFGANEGEINNKILKANKDINRFVCLNGIKKLSDGEKL
ncbi:MAG: glycosyltransferase [Arcobacteraceae bacterium]